MVHVINNYMVPQESDVQLQGISIDLGKVQESDTHARSRPKKVRNPFSLTLRRNF